MHESHQLRLTTLSNQLNQQHAEKLASLRSDHETQLHALNERLQVPDHTEAFKDQIKVNILSFLFLFNKLSPLFLGLGNQDTTTRRAPCRNDGSTTPSPPRRDPAM